MGGHKNQIKNENAVGMIFVATFGDGDGEGSYVYKPNFNFLEMARTNFFSSIRKLAYQPLT